VSGFLVNGFREIARKSSRFSLRRQLAAHDRKRRDALAGLGRTAWQSGTDLTEFSQQREQLQRLDARAGELGATAVRLEKERTDLEARRQAEVARFDGLLQPARARQAEAAAALKTARATLAEKDRAMQAVDTSLARLAADLKKAEDAPASVVGQAGTPPSGGVSREALQQQRAALTEQAAAEAAARQPLAAEVARRSDESARAASEVSRLDAEKRSALVPIDADLKRIQQESSGATRERATVSREQTDRFTDLGIALYDRKSAEPALAAPVEAVAAVDRDRGATQAAVDASLALTAAMPPGTMAKFWTVVVVLPLLCLAAAYVAYSRFASPASSESVETTAVPPAGAGGVRADQMREDDAVKAFVKSKDQSARKDAVEILEADLMELGSSADRSSLPLLEAVLRRGEPELRAAAAHAIGMIGPTLAELPLLVDALNDPAPTVRDAVGSALDQVDDPSGRLLVRRMRSSAPQRSRSREEGLKATVLPEASRLGLPLYAGAKFLTFASDLGAGRVAFASPDPIEKVRQFYQSAAGNPALGGEEFTRMYLGGSPSDPNGARRLGAETEAWFKDALKSGRPQAELEGEMTRRAAQMADLPLVRYADTSLYGSPVFVAFGAPAPEGAPTQLKYVAIFEDRALGRTGFELHLPTR
jgi:hypothetical protein